jgi:hypothetical protein
MSQFRFSLNPFKSDMNPFKSEADRFKSRTNTLPPAGGSVSNFVFEANFD